VAQRRQASQRIAAQLQAHSTTQCGSPAGAGIDSDGGASSSTKRGFAAAPAVVLLA
jgi:hypothetical protein